MREVTSELGIPRRCGAAAASKNDCGFGHDALIDTTTPHMANRLIADCVDIDKSFMDKMEAEIKYGFSLY